MATTPTRRRLPRDDAEWCSLLRMLPGYDPCKDAGDCVFSRPHAVRVIDFFETMLTHVKGELAGTPFLLEDWQRSFLANLFGWLTPDGTRRYQECLLYVPRKAGKTPLAAGIGLYLLACDNEQGAEVYNLASDREQATLVYDHAKGMVAAEPELADRLRVYKSTRAIVYEATNSAYKVVPADATGAHGFNTHGAIIDELHTQPNSELVHAVTTSIAARRQPIILYSTTADYDQESVCNDKHRYACAVRDGTLPVPDRRFLPVIYETAQDADWTDPAVWAAANPNLGVSVKLDYIERACQQAKDDPVYENEFKRLHLNMRTQQAVRWIKMDKWDACGGAVEEEAIHGRPCWLGIDLSSTQDITAVCAVWPLAGESYAARWWFWVPAETMEKRARDDHSPYPVWHREGLIERTEGAVVDYNRVREVVKQIGRDYGVQSIALDPYNATMLATQLSEKDGFEVEFFRQGYLSMSPACKTFKHIMVAGQLRHGGNAVARWMASNVAVTMDAAENVKMVKDKSYGRIDGMVALVMALARAESGDSGIGTYWNEDGASF